MFAGEFDQNGCSSYIDYGSNGRHWRVPATVGNASGISGNEQDFIRAAQNGSLAAFNELVLAYQDRLFGWVVSLVKDDDIAADITQSAFIIAYEKLHTFRGGSFRAWLFQIGRNRSYDELRRQQRRPVISLSQPFDDQDDRELDELLQSGDASPEELVEQKEQSDWVQGVLARLPDEYRQVLILVDMQGLDYQEAAATLNVPLGTVKSRLARGRSGFQRLAGNVH